MSSLREIADEMICASAGREVIDTSDLREARDLVESASDDELVPVPTWTIPFLPPYRSVLDGIEDAMWTSPDFPLPSAPLRTAADDAIEIQAKLGAEWNVRVERTNGHGGGYDQIVVERRIGS